jgi:hypothetical protein
MPDNEDVSGLAALAICESILLALNDHKILPEIEIVGILVDAASAHSAVPSDGIDADSHRAVAELIQKIIDSGNAMRRQPLLHPDLG